MIYEREIIELIGLNTYKGLCQLFPNLYQSQYDVGKKANLYYIQLIQSVMASTGFGGPELRQQLLEAVRKSKNGDDISKMAISSLFNSSIVPENYPASFMTNAWWFLFISLFSILLVVIIIAIFQDFYPREIRINFF